MTNVYNQYSKSMQLFLHVNVCDGQWTCTAAHTRFTSRRYWLPYPLCNCHYSCQGNEGNNTGFLTKGARFEYQQRHYVGTCKLGQVTHSHCLATTIRQSFVDY
jgi:hypothetical protein